MPTHLQAVLVAIYCDGLNERQAARLLGITRHRVRTRHAETLRILQNRSNRQSV
jgi:DNA-directed RNA polymerase specialized sigma24 family protein